MLFRALATALITALVASTTTAQSAFTVDQYGPSCGPVATGQVVPNGATHRFAFTVTQAAPHNHVMLIVGVNELSMPIHFGYDCTLLTELAFTQIHMTDAVGTWTWSHAMGHDFRGWARIQFAEIVFDAMGSLLVRTSNGLYMYYTG